MQNHQDIIADLNKYTVKVITDRTVGTGIIVTPVCKDTSTFEIKENGLILTCYHVVGDANSESKAFYDELKVYFPKSRTTLSAKVITEYCNPEYDIAFLNIKETGKIPVNLKVAPLSRDAIYGHRFLSIGFRKSKQYRLLDATGDIRIETYILKEDEDDFDDRVKPQPLLKLYSDEIEKGMSGAAVLDLETKKIVGIVSLHHPSNKKDDVDNKLNFAIPISSILENSKAGSILKERNPGLKPIYDFVRAIGEEGVIKYEKLPDLYVPPLYYEEIKESLSKNKIVFITGPPEYGKTYTAVYLLWEYFNQGYEPKWLKVGEIKPQDKRSKIRGEFSDIEKHLKSRLIIYYEDPFGKTEYEVKIDEGIIRNIASIIETVENSEKDVYVVITSREEVFKEFEYKILGKVDLKKFEKKLSFKNSYNYEKRKEMLLNHASIRDSKWQQDKVLANTVFETIEKDENKLPTPLNIEQFALAASSDERLDKDDLLKKIDEKSIETSSSFAQEINLMSEDKILFLTFPFISSSFSMDFVKYYYIKLIPSILDDKEQAWEFDKVVEWFKDDKIDISPNWKGENSIRFSHPSYYDALKSAIYSYMDSNKPGKILVRVLYSLSDYKKQHEDDFVIWNVVADEISRNFDKLPEKVQNLLFKMVDNKDAANGVALAVDSNFDKLPENVRNYLLLKVSDNKDAASFVALAVAINFDKLPENVRNKLLLKVSDNKDAASFVAYVVSSNFDKLPEHLRNYLLLKVSDNKDAASFVADVVTSKFDKLPEHLINKLLLKMADNKDTASFVAYVISRKIDRLGWYKYIEPYGSIGVAPNFDKLPEYLINKLLLKMADNEDTASFVAYVVSSKIDKLPWSLREKFFKNLI